MAHIYVSYKHNMSTSSLRDVGAAIIRRLEDAGFKVWADKEQLRPGENWHEAIDEGIRTAFALIVLVTPESLASPFVTYEWAYALGAGVKVIPVIVKPTALHPRLAVLQHLDFVGEGAPAWDRLVRRLAEIEAEHAVGTVRVAINAPPSVKQAIAALESHDTNERINAVKNLSQNNHPTARDALAAAAQHVMFDVRVHASLRLAEASRFADKRAIFGLIDALHDKDPEIRWTAATYLEEYHDPEAVPGLIEALQDNGFGIRPRRAAAKALESIGTPEALRAVREWRYG